MNKIKSWFKKNKISLIDNETKQKIIDEYKNSEQYIIDLQKELEIDFEGEEVKKDIKTEQIKELEQEIEQEQKPTDLKTILTKGVKQNE